MQLPPQPSGNFHLTPEKKRLYDTWFDKLEDHGLLSKDDVDDEVQDKLMIGSELPYDTLHKIWNLSDQDNDGYLDRYEFSIFIHMLVRAYYCGYEIPDQVVISPHSLHSVIILYIAASPSTVPRELVQPLG